MSYAPTTASIARRDAKRGVIRRLAVAALAFAVALPAVALTPPSVSQAAEAPAYGAPDAIASQYYAALLRHTRWAETQWDATAGVYKFADFNFAVVLGNAVLVTHGDYDATLAGVSKESLKQKTIATIKHYAALNRFVNPNGTWGKKLFWDSTFQSYFLVAGKILWNDLDATTRTNLTTIAAEQSRYTANLNYGDEPLSGSWTADWPTGKFDGDTAQEEVGVYTQALAPGIAWAPSDPDFGRWSEQFNNWARNAAGQPTADRNNPAIVAGAAVSTNTMHTIRDTYLVENHGSFGPHYQSDIWRSGGRNAIQFIVNDQPIPEILTEQPNAAELWESIKLVMSDQGEPFMPMVADREYLYGRDVLPIAFLGQVLRDPDAVRAEANLAAALADYQAYAPTDRLTKFSGEPKYEPEARAEIAISYLLHVEAAESDAGVVQPTPQNEFFARLAGTRDFGTDAGLTVQQSNNAWAAALSRKGFVKFPWVPDHNSWMFDVSGNTPYLYPNTGVTVDGRETTRYTRPRDGFDATASLFTIGDGRAGQVTLPTGSAIYASSGAGREDGTFTVRNLDLGGYAGNDGSRTYTTDEGSTTETRPATRPTDARDANAARIDNHSFAPVEARYVRMQGVRGNATFGYSMYKFHVYGTDPTSATDLAAGKTAQASSQDTAGGRTAIRVTEASPTARWAVATADRTRADSWIQVDLGSTQTVGGARLAWESSAGSRYYVQTSTDGSTWTTRSTYGVENAADANVARLDTLDLRAPGASEPSPVEARYVRMQGIQGNPQYGYSMYHFRAFTPAGVYAAANKPATASSIESAARAASTVTDGNASTRWSVANGERTRADSWIQVDLGAPTSIAKVQLGWESAAGRAYKVQVSMDGEEWVDAASFRFTGDQIVSTPKNWLNVEGTAGFVVHGSAAPITVSRETADTHAVRLADAPTGTSTPFLVEMLPGDAAETDAEAARPAPVVNTPGVVASTLDGYLSVFNLTGADASVEVTIPHGDGDVSLFEGSQMVDADTSIVTVDVPAGSAVVHAPRFTVSEASIGDRVVTATVADGRSAEFAATAAGEIAITHVQTEVEQRLEVNADEVSTVTIAGATAFPVRDSALLANTFPASVLPAGMTSPSLAVDGDAATSWRPGADGRMVVDLGAPTPIGSVAAIWSTTAIPGSVVSISDDGLTFRDVAAVPARITGIVPVDETARYVALSTTWAPGDAELSALRVLEPGVVQEIEPGEITGDLPAWQVGRPAAGELAASGTPAPQFFVSDGELPAGVTLDPSGSFSGTPTTAGTFEFTITADNGATTTTTRDFSIEVEELGLTVTSDPANANGDNGWFTSDIVLTAGVDGLDVSALLQARVDGGEWAVAPTPVTVTGDGSHEVQFRAVTEAGDILDSASWTGRIDANSPVSSASVDEAARSVTVRAADATSGLARIETRVGDAAWSTYTGAVVVGNARTVVEFRAVDKAGNVEAAGQAIVPKAGVTLVKSLTAAVIADDVVAYYDANSVTVRVSGEDAQPTGTVTVIAGGVEVGTGELVDGRVRIALDRAGLLPGDYTLQVRYSGDARYESSTDTVELEVTKAAATVKATFAKSTITGSQTPKLTIVVSSAAPVTGTVAVKEGSRTLKAKTTLVNGRLTVSLPKLTRGTHKVEVRYSGSDTVLAAKSAKVSIKVK